MDGGHTGLCHRAGNELHVDEAVQSTPVSPLTLHFTACMIIVPVETMTLELNTGVMHSPGHF